MRLIMLIFLLVFTLPFQSFAQKKRKIDSLLQVLIHAKDSTRIKSLVELAWAYRNSNTDTAIRYGTLAIQEAIASKYKRIQPLNYVYLGVFYRNKGNYTKALENYFLAVKISEELKDYERLGYAFQSIGDINNRQGDYEDAIKFTQQGLLQFEQIHDNMGISYCYYTLGNIYRNKKNFGLALKLHERSLELRKPLGDKGTIASSLGVLAAILYEQKQLSHSTQYAQEAQKLFKETNDLRGLASMANHLSRIAFDKKLYDSALLQADEALLLAQKSGNIEYMKDSYYTKFKVYKVTLQSKQAYDYQKLYLAYEDSLLNQEKGRQTITLESKYYNEKQRLQIAALDNEEASRKYMLYVVSLASICVVALIILSVRHTNQRKKIAHLLKEHTEEISSKAEELTITLDTINSKNTYITNSIAYALKIQKALLVSEKDLKEKLPTSFVLFKPKDVISGDFYWFAEKGEGTHKKQILAVADCTGHGVPGAFMSMIGDSLLNQLVHDKEIHAPHTLLDLLDIGIRKTLHQEETSQNDGMDIAIIVLHYEASQLNYIHFAGAMNPIYLVENIGVSPKIHTLKADKKPIGGNTLYTDKKRGAENFSLTTLTMVSEETVLEQRIGKSIPTVQIHSPAMIYMCSDGFQDQFGGTEDRKFMTSHLRTLLETTSIHELDTQKTILETTFEQWKGSRKQTDDVTIIGLKV